jgi:hypothetical protein
MLYGAPEVPRQEKEPVQRVAQSISVRTYSKENAKSQTKLNIEGGGV